MMNNKLVTLFGGGGFVGRYVAQALLRAGARVRVAQRDPRQAYFLKPQGGLGQTQFIAVDVTRPDTIARALTGADAAVNLVGRFDQVDRVNRGGAGVVAQAAAAAGLGALVHVSAIGADPSARAGYAQSKGEGEAAVRQAFPGATILRPATIFGREDQFLNRFAGMIARLPVVPVLRGAARFQPVFVADVAEAVAAALSAPDRFGGTTFELGGPDVMTLEALNRWLADAIERRPSFAVLPDAVGSLIARGGFLPGAPITWDQWLMLQRDTVADPALPGLAELGVVPTPLASVAPSWLVRFRRNGRFGDRLQDLA